MNVTSIARFALVALLFVIAYHFFAFFAVMAIGTALISDLAHWLQSTYDDVPEVSAYDELKSAFDEIFEEPEAPTVLEVDYTTYTYRQLQLELKERYTAAERKAHGIKLNSTRATLIKHLA